MRTYVVFKKFGRPSVNTYCISFRGFEQVYHRLQLPSRRSCHVTCMCFVTWPWYGSLTSAFQFCSAKHFQLISLGIILEKSRRGYLNAHPILCFGTVYIFEGFVQGLHARLWRTSRQASLFTVCASILTPQFGGSSSATEASWPRCLASRWSPSCTRGRVTCLTVSVTECDSRDERWVCVF